MQTQTTPQESPAQSPAVLSAETMARENFRTMNGVKLVDKVQAGESSQKLPAGLYGFSYSPFGTETPIFQTHPVDSYEVHTVKGGESLVVCFATEAVTALINSGKETEMLELFPEIVEPANVPLLVPISRMAGAKPLVRDSRNCLRVRMLAK